MWYILTKQQSYRCVSVWETPKLQNRAAHFISFSDLNKRSSTLLGDLGWHSLEQRRSYQFQIIRQQDSKDLLALEYVLITFGAATAVLHEAAAVAAAVLVAAPIVATAPAAAVDWRLSDKGKQWITEF